MMKTFADQIKDFSAKVKTQCNDTVSILLFKIYEEVDKRSPVGDQELWIYNKGTKENPEYVHWLAYNDKDGYVGGHFRANWQLGVGTLPTTEVAGVDPQGDATQGRILAAIPDEAAGKVYYLANTAPYAMRLENGWSTQAPAGMVGLAVSMFPELIDVSVKIAKAKADSK